MYWNGGTISQTDISVLSLILSAFINLEDAVVLV